MTPLQTSVHTLGVEIPPWKLIHQQLERPTTLDPRRFEAAAKIKANEIPMEAVVAAVTNDD